MSAQRRCCWVVGLLALGACAQKGDGGSQPEDSAPTSGSDAPQSAAPEPTPVPGSGGASGVGPTGSQGEPAPSTPSGDPDSGAEVPEGPPSTGIVDSGSESSDGSTPSQTLDGASPVGSQDAGESQPNLDALRFASYPEPPYPAENPHTDAKALLGKVLFWEEQLSGDDTVACGTCHRGAAGGSDPRSAEEVALLPGPDGVFATADDLRGSPGLIACDENGVQTGTSVQVTGRKAPSYLDAMFAQRLFWDGRAECAVPGCPSIDAFEDPDNPGTFPIAMFGALENQAVGPPLNSVEMACAGATWPDLHEKLRTSTPLALAREVPDDMAEFIAQNGASYPELFAAAFGDEQTSGMPTEINTRRIAFAIATHERRLMSNQTPWDLFNAGDDAALTPAQIRGLRVFRERAKCSTCHLPPLFGDGAFHYTGFHKPSLDLGREAINGRATDRGEMRTPTLRNVGLRVAGGLLHTGAGIGASLESVIETYMRGGLVDDSEVTAVPITETIETLDLSPDEVADLIDFLVNGLTDPRVAAELPPFDRPTLSTEVSPGTEADSGL